MSQLDPIKVRKIMNKIQALRAGNNKNWMELIKLALIYAPVEETLKIIDRIILADTNVVTTFKEIKRK